MKSGSSSKSSTEAPLRIGIVGRAHGTEGAFVVNQPTERLELLEPGRTITVAGRELIIQSRKGTAAHPMLKLERIDGRELRGEPITVPRSALGALGEGEFLVDDLTGCEAFDGSRRVGRVRDVLLMPSADLLEIERDGADALFVPLVGDAVRSVDVEAGRIEIDTTFIDE
jgi:16S rRNA processing protein RimM